MKGRFLSIPQVLLMPLSLSMSLAWAGTAPSPATIQGIVYQRDATVAYGVDSPLAPVIEGATVNLGPAGGHGATNGAGAFMVSASKFGYLPLVVSRAGNIPSMVTLNVASGGSYTANIGLYPTTTVIPRPGFIGGAVTWDAGNAPDFYLPSGLFPSTYARMKRTLGANLAVYFDRVFVTSYSASKNTVTMASRHARFPGLRMLREDEYRALVHDAHSKGLQFMLGLSPSGDGTYITDMLSTRPGQTAFWDSWFSAYQPILVQYATMARKLNIEYLYIGLNSGFATRLSSMRWEKLISAIKGTGYAGKIGYFGMTNPDGPYYESDHYNTTEGGSSPASFMSLFNFIGVDVYNVIPRARSRQATDPTQSRIAIKSAMQTLLAKTAS